MRNLALPLALLVAFLVAPPGALLLAQSQGVLEEDLSLSELEQTAAPPSPGSVAELQAELDAALEMFASADQGASLPAFGRIIEILEQRSVARPLSGEEVELLASTLGYRARARFNLGDTEGARADLASLLEARPEEGLDATQVSPRLLDLFSKERLRIVGDLDLQAEPPDARVEIDGRVIERAGLGPFGVRAGAHRLVVSRPGYAAAERSIEIRAGRTSTASVQLERTGPVVRVLTRPRGAEILVDGEVRGVTEGTAPTGFLPEGAAALYRRDEFSAEIILDELEPGLRRFEVRRPGFRTYRAELEIVEPIDYVIPPIVLEEEQATLVLRGLPANTDLRIDDEPARVDNPGAPLPQILLPPGEHRLAIRQGPARMFQRTLRLADRQTVEVDVRLRPGLVFLGVLGGDRTAASRLTESLVANLTDSTKWTVLDRSSEGEALLQEAGLHARGWRRGGAFGPEIDWKAVQSRVGDRFAGLTYVTAVLSDDLVADRADVVVWPSAPGPATPSSLSVGIGNRTDIERVKGLFEGSVPLRRPWAGLLLADSDAVPHPVIAHVTPAGPAAAAGVRTGDLLVTFAGRPVTDSAAFHAALEATPIGEAVELGVQGPGGARAVRVTLGSTPWISPKRDAELLDPVAFSELVLLEDGASREDRWIIRVNQALISLRARDWQAAIRRFREAGAPVDDDGMGQAAVDYWTGIALARLGGGYVDQAIGLFERAASARDARLYHHDGPWVAPLARARLAGLRISE